jgi:hypothetical protein
MKENLPQPVWTCWKLPESAKTCLSSWKLPEFARNCSRLLKTAKIYQISPKSNSFGIFGMPPRIGISLFSNNVKVYRYSRLQGSCSLFTLPKKSTPLLGMCFWWGIPNSARAMNKMVHHPWLLQILYLFAKVPKLCCLPWAQRSISYS